MPLAPAFSESDREKIRLKLQALCKQYWISKGYKKTSVKEICADTGISIGTFYTIYPTKEDLFYATIVGIQDELERQFLDTIQDNPTLDGFARALKQINLESSKIPFLYEANTPDFLAFITKQSEEALEKLKSDRMEFARKVLHMSKFKLKVSEDKALGVISALQSTILAKSSISVIHDYFDVFDFMADNLIANIFEES